MNPDKNQIGEYQRACLSYFMNYECFLGNANSKFKKSDLMIQLDDLSYRIYKIEEERARLVESFKLYNKKRRRI